MNNKSCLYYVVSDPVKDKAIDGFNNLSIEHKQLLFSSLFDNAMEQICSIVNINKIILSPEKLNPVLSESHSQQIEILNYSENEKNLEKIIESQSREFGRNLIIYSNTIGFSSNDITRVFDLLMDEGDTLVIGKARDDKICFVGANFLDSQFLKNLSTSRLEFDSLLKKIKRNNVNYFVLNGFLKIEELKDFKDLYSLLSNRISENFCKENIHEKFTNLFIEYKELLQ